MVICHPQSQNHIGYHAPSGYQRKAYQYLSVSLIGRRKKKLLMCHVCETEIYGMTTDVTTKNVSHGCRYQSRMKQVSNTRHCNGF